MRRRRLAALAAAALVATSAPLVVATPASAQAEPVCPGVRYVYVAHAGGAKVTVIDATKDQPDEDCMKILELADVDTEGIDAEGPSVDPDKVSVSGGVAPFGVVAAPDGGRVYVTHGVGNLVSVIPTGGADKNTVAATFEVGSTKAVVLTGAAVSPDSARLYVVATAAVEEDGSGSGLLYPIETAEIGTPGAVGDPIPVGNAPTGVAVASTPHGERVYVTNTGGGTVSVLEFDPTNRLVPVDDDDDGAADDPVEVGLAPTDVVANPKRNEVYVLNSGSDTVSVIDTAENREVGGWGAWGLGGIAVSPHGEWAYVTTGPTISPFPISLANLTGYGRFFRVNLDDPDNTETFRKLVVHDYYSVFVDIAPTGMASDPEVGDKVYVANTGGYRPDQQLDGSPGSVTVVGVHPTTVLTASRVEVDTAPTAVAVAKPPTPPVILGGGKLELSVDGERQESYTVIEGKKATFEVKADGTQPLTFQWHRDGKAIPDAPTCMGANRCSYTIEKVTRADDGARFQVKVDNPAKDPKFSNEAVLTVSPATAPVVVTPPRNRTVDEGETATFLPVEVVGATPLTYQWRRDGEAIPGASGELTPDLDKGKPTGKFVTSPYTTPPATVERDHGAVYDVVVSNARGTVTSAQAVLTVVPVGGFAPNPPDPGAPAFRRLGTLWGAGNRLAPGPLAVDPANQIAVTNGRRHSVLDERLGLPAACSVFGGSGPAVYAYDLPRREVAGFACTARSAGAGVFQSRPGAGGRFLQGGVRPPAGPSLSFQTADLRVDPEKWCPGLTGLAYGVAGAGAGRAVSVGTTSSVGVPLLLRDCPRVGGAPVDDDAVALASPSGRDEVVTLEVDRAGALARLAHNHPTLGFAFFFEQPLQNIYRMDRRAHERVLVRSLDVAEADFLAFGEAECGTTTNDNGDTVPLEMCAKAGVDTHPRWEVDLTAFCPSFLDGGDWVARTDDAVLTYCWDERPPGTILQMPGLATKAPQGYLIRIPLGPDGYPIPRPGTEGLASTGTGVGRVDERGLIYEAGSGGPRAEPEVRNAPPQGGEDGPCDPSPGNPTGNPPEPVSAEGCEPGVEEGDPRVEPDVRVLNATVRRIPTLSGPVSLFADPESGRVFLLTSDEANGAAVWALDPVQERFTGVATSGIPWEELKRLQKDRAAPHPEAHRGGRYPLWGHQSAAGFNPELGRAYVLSPTEEGAAILVVDGRGDKIQGVSYPALSIDEVLPGSLTADGEIAVDDAVRTLTAYSAGGRHYVAVPIVGQGYALFEDTLPVPEVKDPLDPDRLTTQVDEREGETVATLSGAGEAAGAHVVVAGGVTKTANTASPICRGFQIAEFSPATGFAIDFKETLSIPNVVVRTYPAERRMYDGECLADLLFAQGHREAYLGSTRAESGSSGATANAGPVRLPTSDNATDADLRDAAQCKSSGARRGAEGAVDYPTHALVSDFENLQNGDPAGDPGLLGTLFRFFMGDEEGNKFFNALEDEPEDWVPKDEDDRNSRDRFGPLFDGLFAPSQDDNPDTPGDQSDAGGGYTQLCDQVQKPAPEEDNPQTERDEREHLGLFPRAGVDLSEGTEGFAERAECVDFDADDGKGSSGEARGPLGEPSEVACDAGVPKGEADSSAAAMALPSRDEPLVLVESLDSSVDSHREVRTFTIDGRNVDKAIQVTEATAVAEGVHLGPVSIGAVRATARVTAGGRTGTAQATLTREWCDVTVGAEVLAQGCSVVTGPEDPLVARVADELSQVAPKLRISVPRANGPSGLGEATPGGAQSVVIKDEGLRVTDDTVNDDDSITVPALQVVFLNDGPEGRNRWVVQLAGVEAEARYGINVLPTFQGSSFSSSFSSSKATPSTRRVLPGRKSLPRASTLIEGEAFDDFGSDLPVPGNPVQRFVTWIPEALKDLLRLLIQHPLEFALLFLVFSLLATPGYLAYRRRTFLGVVT